MNKMTCKPATMDAVREKKSTTAKSKASPQKKTEGTSQEIPEPSSGLGLVALEPRIMFDGAALATGAEVIQDTTTQDQTVIPGIDGDTSTNSTTTDSSDDALWSSGLSLSAPSDRKEIVFIDTSVDDFQTLMDGIDPNAEVILLDPTRDGVEQIAEILGERSNIDAVHIISHGDSGELRLGTGLLNTTSMQGEYADELATINQALTEEADFLIYGCNFGEGESGGEAATLLAELTGADIAASSDLTGAENLGGDWELEVQTGSIESEVIVDEQAQENFVGVLDITTGLVGHWNFDEDATDSSGNNYDGTLQGDASIDTSNTTDIVGEGKLALDGAGDQVNLDAHISNFSGLTEGTISAWVKLTDTGESIIFGLSDKNEALDLIKFGIEGGQLKWLNLNDALDDVVVYSTATVNDGAWHHVAVTVNSSGNTLYIDGAVASVSYSSGSSSTTAFFDDITNIDAMDIGRSVRGGVTEGEFNGLTDDVRVYNRALSAADIAELATLESSPGSAIWSASGDGTPNVNDWDGTSFGTTTDSADLSFQLRIVEAAEAPTRDEKIVIGVDGTIGQLRGEIWDGSTWTALPFSMGFSADNTAQSFDVVYESQSGDAMVVWNNGAGGTASVSYRIWDGTTWSAEQTITAPDAGVATQLRLAANPTSDEMVLIVSDDNTDEWAAVWDGSSWGNTVVLDTVTTSDRNEISVAFESQTGHAMVVYDGVNNFNDLTYQTWNGTTWSGQQTLTLPNTGAETDVEFTTLASDPTSDRIALGVVAGGTQNHVLFAVWDGTAWGDTLMASTSGWTGNSLNAAVAFESHSGDLLVTYGEASTTPRYQTWSSGSGWSGEMSLPNIGAYAQVMELTSDPLTNSIMLGVQDSDSDLHYIHWNGEAWGSDNEVSTNTGETVLRPFTFVFDAATPTPNAAPVNTVPGAQAVAEDTVLSISSISVNDTNGNLSTVQLSVTNGSLNVTLSGSATISAGANGTNTLTLSGSQADINSTLASLTYQGALNYVGADTLTVLSTDSNGATDSDNVAITVGMFVDTTSDVSDGDTSSTAALLANRGADGKISLREAIAAANNTSGLDSISFNILDALISGAHTIDVLSALPDITDAVIIDGTTEPDYSGTPIIELDGSSAGSVDGLRLISGSDGSTIRGLVINQFGSQGIEINNSDGNAIAGNYIGTDVTGTVDLGNGSAGIYLWSAQNNTIGGTTAADRNLISGNQGSGILRQGSNGGNVIQGNYIGTDVTGTLDLGNSQNGIAFAGSGADTIGGSVPGAGNLISGNNMDGISIGVGANGVTIQGNYIGTNAAGTGAIANSGDGISLASDNNQVGGTTVLERNIISGNTADGILITGHNNTVTGNYIGIDVAGTTALANGDDGVWVGSGATGTTIGGTTAGAGNVISGNVDVGIVITGTGTSGTVVQGNYIGTNAAGTGAVANGDDGIWIGAGATNSTIGGTTAAARNIISGNTMDGVQIHDVGTTGHVVAGNYIGTDVTGNVALANGDTGVSISGGATGNTIGGTTSAHRNVISGNTAEGVHITGSGTDSNTVSGNYIGVDSTGAAALGNGIDGVRISASASSNTIGGTTAGERNIISGNADDGIQVSGTGNIIRGNYIGTDVTGTVDLGNGDEGIEVSSATNTIIGGSVVGARNVIAGNTSAGIRDDNSSGTTIQGNYIGVDSTGTATLANSFGIQTWNGSSNGIIGGAGANEGNVIGGNTNQGIILYSSSGYTVQGNYIGTDSTGTLDLGNLQNGIYISGGSNHLIGGTGTGEGNIIAFNNVDGIAIFSTSTGNTIIGNQIYSNDGLGIDLQGGTEDAAGVTANDAGDADAGANLLQNYPVLSTVSTSGTQVIINGSLNSTASTTFRIEFFASATADGSYYGEAERYLGFTTVTTDGSGDATISETLSAVVAAGEHVTATATVIDDAGQVGIDDLLAYGVTSEFGLSVLALSLAPVNSVPAAQTTNEDTALIFNAANSNLISITDDPGESLEVTVSVTNGTVTLSQTTGLVITAGANGTNTMTVTGTVENINAALDGLQYDPTADYNGSDALTLTTNDATLLALNIDTNLQGYYEFTSGDPGNDSSPSGTNDGTLNGDATVVNDAERGEVLSLDGNGDYLQINNTFGDSQDITIGGWVNLSGSSSGRAEFISIDDRVHIALDDASGIKGSVQTAPGVWTDLHSNQFIAGTGWHQITYVFDGTNDVHRLYIDGVEVASAANTNTIDYTGATTTYIGRHPSTSPSWDLEGMVDDVRIYDRALTASEIADIAAGPVSATDTDTVAITVNPVNDAPVNTVPGAQVVLEDTPLAISGISVNDVDGNLSTVQLSVTNGTLNVTLNGSSTISAGANGSSTLTLSGSQADINATLASLSYQGNLNYTGADTLTVTSTDGNSATDVDMVGITVNAVNDVPVAVGDSVNTPEDTALIIDPMANDTDAESDTLSIVEFTQPTNGTVVNNGDGTVTYTPGASYTGADSFDYVVTDTGTGLQHYWGLDGEAVDAIGSADGTLNGTTTVAGAMGDGLSFNEASDYALLPDVTYTSEFSISFDFKLDDNSGSLFQYLYSHGDINATNSVNIFINEDAHGTDPNVMRTVIRDANDTLDNFALQFDISSIVGDSQWHTYTVTVGANGIEVFLDGVSMASDATRGTDGVNPTGGVYLGARQDLAADRFYGSSLDSIRIYDNALHSTQVTDLASGQTRTTVNITVDPVNDAPTVNNLGGDALAYTEGDGAQVIEQGSNAAVTDVDSANFDTGTLTVNFQAGSDSAEDVLAIRDEGAGPSNITVSGSTVSYGGTQIGTFTGGTGGTDLVITLDADADATAVSALIQNITYENTDTDNPTTGGRTVRYVLTDGDGGTSANYDTTVTVSGSNDQAVADLNGADGGGINFTTTFTEGLGAINVTDSDAMVSDVDNTTYDTLGINLSGFVDGGSEKITVAGYTFTYGTAETVVRTVGATDFEIDFDGSGFSIQRDISGEMPEADVQALIRSIIYENLSENPTVGNRTLDFIPQDGDALVGLTSISTVSVVAQNDAPVISSNGGGDTASLNVVENTTAVTTVTSTDVDGGTAVYSITGGLDAAKFSINSSTGELVFQAAPDFENPTDSDGDNVYVVTVQVSDGNGGTDTQTISVTVTDVANTLTVTTTIDNNDSGITDGNSAHTIEWLNANMGGDGAISLREAIIAANNTSGLDTIGFNLALTDANHVYYQDDGIADSLSTIAVTTLADGAIVDFDPDYVGGAAQGFSWWRMQPTSELPDITDAVIIDASTQTGWTAGQPIVELNGSLAGTGANLNGFSLNSSAGSTIRGLAINQFDWAGIQLNGGGGHTIVGNFIGTDITGTQDLGNRINGIEVSSFNNNNVIGGSTLAERNVIAGNNQGEILLGSGTGNTVQGNYLGVDVTGMNRLGSSYGLRIYGDSNQIGGTGAGEKNVIAGVRLETSAQTNTFEGNFIGTNAAGTASIAGTWGMVVYGSDNVIGGTAAEAGNVIAGNSSIGIWLSGTSATGNLVQGNFIGTDITGTLALGNGDGVRIDGGASNNTIGGNTAGARNIISSNTSDGIEISGATSTGNIVQGNYIGTDVTGTVDLGNNVAGIRLNGANNIIGGTAAGEGNVIAGNSSGITIASVDATGNTIEGNYIGTDATGSTALGNSFGIWVTAGSGNVLGGTASGSGNVIAGNTNHGVYLLGSGTTGNFVQGNYIGTTPGSLALGNGGAGVYVSSGASNNTIGGTSTGARNVISSNTSDGIYVTGAGTDGNVIKGNFIGTNVAGTAALGNGDRGIQIEDNAANTQIGGTAAGAGNVISGNSNDGILLSNSSTGTVIEGNYIGTDLTGTTNIGNGTWGVRITNSSGNTVGGTAVDAGNTIAFNTQAGIGLQDASGTNNSILGNAIYLNLGIGIDLGIDGVTANDTGDGDTGPNDLQNFPVLTSVSTDGSNLNLIGTFNSTASTTYRIEFFASTTADGSGYGEAERYLGFATVTTDGSGNAIFNTTLAAAVGLGEFVTATATVDLGGGNYGKTSEFAANVAAGNPIPFIDLDADDSSGAGITNFVTSFTEDGGPVTLADSDATLTDLDSANLTSLTVTITNLQDGAFELLAADTTGTSITASYDSGTGVLTLSGTDTVVNYEQVLRTVMYDNTSDSPTTTTRVIQFQANDGTYSGNIATTNLTVTAVNDAPVNTVPGAQTVAEDSSLAISGISVTDVDGNLSTVQLSVTNGTLNVMLSGSATISAGANGSNTLTLSGSQADINATLTSLSYQGTLNYTGSDTLTITSTDGNSATDVDTVAITVTNVDDAATIGGQTSYSGNEGDVGSGTLTATDPDGLTDGTYFTVTTPASNGTAAIDPATGAWTFTPTDPNWFGTDSFTVTVTDDQGGTTTQVISVTLANVDDAATIGGQTSYSGNEGDVGSGTLTATDPDGLTDGTYFTVTTPASNGTAAIDPATGAWTFTPTDPNWFGTDSFTVTVTDDLGGTTTQVVSVTLANVDDAAVITGDVSYSGNEGDAVAGDLNATDVDGLTDGTYFSVMTPAANGTASIDAATGAWTFTPTDPNWFGSDSFTVMVTDDLGGTTTQVVNVTLANVDDAAVITGDTSYTGNEGDVGSGTLTATDPDGLTDGTYFTVTTPATNGTAAIDAMTGAWTFTPSDPNWYGSDSFTVMVTDDQGGMTTQVVSVTLANVNDAPVANDDSFTTPENTSISATLATGVLANDTDVDGDTLTVSTTPIVDVSNGTLVLNTDGRFTYTPNSGWSGVDTFTYQVTDGNGGSAQATVTITVMPVNSAPVITSHGGGAMASVSLAENLTNVAAMTATDPDGDPLTYTIVGGADAAHFTIDATTGTLQFTNSPDFENPTDVGGDNLYEVQVQVSDGQGGTDVQAFAITVTDVMEGTAPPPPLDPMPEPSPEPTPESDPSPEPMPEPELEGEPPVLPPSGSGSADEATREGAYVDLVGRGPENHAPNEGGRDVVNVLDLPPLLRPGAWATTSDQIRSYYASPVDMTKTELPTEFLQQLNTFSDELEENLQEETGARSMLVNMVKSTGLALSTGLVAWMVRGGTLLTGLMAVALPAWRQFDPVPILGMDKKDQEAWTRRVKEAATMEAREHQGLEQILQDGEKMSPASTLTNTSSDTPPSTTSS